jgi:hypothetical protein
MGDDVKVDKGKFDALLGRMLSTEPLPKSEVKVRKLKPFYGVVEKSSPISSKQ